MKQEKSRTSWQGASDWYNQIVGEEGHYYHQTLILPKLLSIFKFKPTEKQALLDLACGQGILERQIDSPTIGYTGVDASKELITSAKKMARFSQHAFIYADITKPLNLDKESYTHASVVLALQNIEDYKKVFVNAAKALKPDGLFVIVINHPCFRIPRQSSWKIDEASKTQYRRIDKYMSPMEIPIQTHPGKGKESSQTFSFHHPLSDYTKGLQEAGFWIETIEEWCSNKTSQGAKAKMENRARLEIPLFMAIVARKKAT